MKHAGYPYTQSDAFINAQRKKCEHCGELHHPSVRCRCRCVRAEEIRLANQNEREEEMSDTNGIHVSRIDDWVFITADGWALEDWAHRPGASWPCSRLAMLPAGVHIETRNGDLMEIGPDPSMPYAMTDLRAYRDIPADEVSAFIDYALTA